MSAARQRLRPAAGLGPLLLVVSLLAAACNGPILANPGASLRPEPVATPGPSQAADPVPIQLPLDDGAHDRLTEWWYYTGHLRDLASGAEYGFEYVIFRAERGGFPVTWASHLAITDQAQGLFQYAQRSVVGPEVDQVPGPGRGFALDLGPDPTDPSTAGRPPWTMAGVGGNDHLAAQLSPAEATTAGVPAGLGLDLTLTSAKPAVLEGGSGWIDFGPAGGSYYYSRTDLLVTGTIDVDGHALQVDGTAWFDHQWGDFIAVGGGGWDWFAVNLADGTDLTISLVRAADGTDALVYGTLVDASGRASHLDRSAFSVQATAHWTSPLTGVTYPAGWTVSIPGQALQISLRPTVAGQELDTRATTGVIYWEGSQVVQAVHAGQAIGGQGYVELTGYAPGS
ncbi:MAG TPA: lipocalin family protein [Candidatus Limnocylindrales bacterium]|nr:lipocalin family protein [Candidatus Limnocylindrales bacterium]